MFPWMNPLFYPKLPTDYDIPPTIYSILNSYVNFDSEVYTRIENLAKNGRQVIFDFNYPLSEKINKEDFEKMILNKFMMRRIGYETVTAFKIALNVKLNEIMPIYNKLFDSLDGWDIMNDGEMVVSESNTSATSESTGRNDNRYSETPQGRLSDIEDGSYMSDYTLNKTSGNASFTGNSKDTIVRTPSDKIRIWKEFKENTESIYSLIFKDLEELFYFLV